MLLACCQHVVKVVLPSLLSLIFLAGHRAACGDPTADIDTHFRFTLGPCLVVLVLCVIAVLAWVTLVDLISGGSPQVKGQRPVCSGFISAALSF